MIIQDSVVIKKKFPKCPICGSRVKDLEKHQQRSNTCKRIKYEKEHGYYAFFVD